MHNCPNIENLHRCWLYADCVSQSQLFSAQISSQPHSLTISDFRANEFRLSVSNASPNGRSDRKTNDINLSNMTNFLQIHNLPEQHHALEKF